MITPDNVIDRIGNVKVLTARITQDCGWVRSCPKGYSAIQRCERAVGIHIETKHVSASRGGIIGGYKDKASRCCGGDCGWREDMGWVTEQSQRPVTSADACVDGRRPK